MDGRSNQTPTPNSRACGSTVRPTADVPPRVPSPLTVREAEILYWISKGKTNKEVAKLLFLSPHTIKSHLWHIYNRIGVRNRYRAIVMARQNGWI